MAGDKLTNAPGTRLHTKSRFENVVNEGLWPKKRFLSSCRKLSVKSRRRDRHKMIKRALFFPDIVFVRTDLNPYEHIEILKTTGAVRLIGSARGPVPIADATVDSLKIMVSTEGEVITGTRFKKGDRVMVVSGPFAGVTGVFQATAVTTASSLTSRPWASSLPSTWMPPMWRNCRKYCHNCLTFYKVLFYIATFDPVYTTDFLKEGT
jgi:transcriptional antiterminator NusG